MVEQKTILVVSLLLSTVVVASTLGYWFVGHTPQIVKENVTVYGDVARRAGEASYLLEINGLTLVNESLQVKLIKYEGKYYYLSSFPYGHNGVVTTYTVWVDNSTYYCATPKVRDIPTCP
jgi:hypothetical protein